MPYTIRRATADDAPAIARQRVAMFRDIHPTFSESDAADVYHATRTMVSELLGSGEYVAWVAEQDGVVVAGAGAFLHRLLPRAGRLLDPCESYVLNVYTEPAHRRKGLARQLMDEVVSWSRARGVARVTLHASEAGRPLYEQMGFTHTNEWRLDF